MFFVATALVTGGTSGLGYEAARFLAQEHPDWRVLLVSRKGADAATTLNAALKKVDGRTTPNVFFLSLDCSSLKAVRQFAQTYLSAAHPPLAALVLNAGVQVVNGVQFSPDDIELTFATNHVGQALLFFLLQGQLTPQAHIIYTSSGVHDPKQGTGLPEPHYLSGDKCAHPDNAEELGSALEGRRRYALSKLVNVLWVYELRRRAQAAGKAWTIGALDPGEQRRCSMRLCTDTYCPSPRRPGLMPGTALARDAALPLRIVWLYVLPNLLFLLRLFIPNTYTPAQSGWVLANLASKNGLVTDEESTAYWQQHGPVKSSDVSYSKDKQADLWTWTLATVADTDAERKRFAGLQG